jgi:hypothetical protein
MREAAEEMRQRLLAMEHKLEEARVAADRLAEQNAREAEARTIQHTTAEEARKRSMEDAEAQIAVLQAEKQSNVKRRKSPAKKGDARKTTTRCTTPPSLIQVTPELCPHPTDEKNPNRQGGRRHAAVEREEDSSDAAWSPIACVENTEPMPQGPATPRAGPPPVDTIVLVNVHDDVLTPTGSPRHHADQPYTKNLELQPWTDVFYKCGGGGKKMNARTKQRHCTIKHRTTPASKPAGSKINPLRHPDNKRMPKPRTSPMYESSFDALVESIHHELRTVVCHSTRIAALHRPATLADCKSKLHAEYRQPTALLIRDGQWWLAAVRVPGTEALYVHSSRQVTPCHEALLQKLSTKKRPLHIIETPQHARLLYRHSSQSASGQVPPHHPHATTAPGGELLPCGRLHTSL